MLGPTTRASDPLSRRPPPRACLRSRRSARCHHAYPLRPRNTANAARSALLSARGNKYLIVGHRLPALFAAINLAFPAYLCLDLDVLPCVHRYFNFLFSNQSPATSRSRRCSASNRRSTASTSDGSQQLPHRQSRAAGTPSRRSPPTSAAVTSSSRPASSANSLSRSGLRAAASPARRRAACLSNDPPRARPQPRRGLCPRRRPPRALPRRRRARLLADSANGGPHLAGRRRPLHTRPLRSPQPPVARQPHCGAALSTHSRLSISSLSTILLHRRTPVHRSPRRRMLHRNYESGPQSCENLPGTPRGTLEVFWNGATDVSVRDLRALLYTPTERAISIPQFPTRC